MKEIIIFSHQGLGDLILCNAIVRNYTKLYDKVYVLAKNNNYHDVVKMYSDDEKIEVIEINWDEVKNIYNDDIKFSKYLNDKKLIYDKILKIGYSNNGEYFDVDFYKHANLDFEKRWDDFFIKRDIDREIKLFKQLNLKEREYILVNKQSSMGELNFKFDENIINKDKKIVYTDKITDSIFDWCYIIENALEIHTICSSFKHLMDSLDLSKCQNLIYYHSIRSDSITKSKNNWKYI